MSGHGKAGTGKYDAVWERKNQLVRKYSAAVVKVKNTWDRKSWRLKYQSSRVP